MQEGVLTVIVVLTVTAVSKKSISVCTIKNKKIGVGKRNWSGHM